MKKIILLTALIGTLVSANPTDQNSTKKELPPVVVKGVSAIKMLGKELKSNLKAKLKEDSSGIKAIEFCTTKAMEITGEVNSKLPKGTTVRRVSLKYRNEANKPDSIDEETLKQFQKELESGKFVKKPKVVDANGTKRVYVPLLVSKVCTKCHGKNIDPKIAEAIKKSYPTDRAIDFKEGDLRGAMVAEIKDSIKK